MLLFHVDSKSKMLRPRFWLVDSFRGRCSDDQTFCHSVVAQSKTCLRFMCSHSGLYMVGILSTCSFVSSLSAFFRRMSKREDQGTRLVHALTAFKGYPRLWSCSENDATSWMKRSSSEDSRASLVVSPITSPFLTCIGCAEDHGR